MRAYRQHHAGTQVVLGLFVIGLGLLFLLDNLDLLNFRFSEYMLPMLVALFGIMKMVQGRSSQAKVVGAILVAAGALLALHTMGYVELSWQMLWPVLIIGAGLRVVLRSLHGHRHPELMEGAGRAAQAGDDAFINVTAFLGGYKRRIASDAFRGGDLTVIMSGCQLDLRQCDMAGDAELDVFVLFGGVEIQVPPDWTVLLHGTPILGAFDERTIVPKDGSKRLLIRGCAMMGGVEVRN